MYNKIRCPYVVMHVSYCLNNYTRQILMNVSDIGRRESGQFGVV